MIQALSMTELLFCSYQYCFSCGNTYKSSPNSRELLPFSTLSIIHFSLIQAVPYPLNFMVQLSKKISHIPKVSYLAPFSYLQCQKIINVIGKTNLIASTLFSPIQNYLHSAYCQFFFTTIEHFPARASFERRH